MKRHYHLPSKADGADALARIMRRQTGNQLVATVLGGVARGVRRVAPDEPGVFEQHAGQRLARRPGTGRYAVPSYDQGGRPVRLPITRPAQGVTSPEELSYVFYFAPKDKFGLAARAYATRYYPRHRRFEVHSFEHLFEILEKEGRTAGKKAGTTRIHVEEIVIVTHANEHGGMQARLTNSGSRVFTPSAVAALQKEVTRGLHKSFMSTRARALVGIDERTRIVVRGCELGKNGVEPLDALAVLFGGKPRVMAPRAFQGFAVEGIGRGWRFSTFDEAYDWLVDKGYLAETMGELTASEKKKYISELFGHGIPTEFFLVGDEDYATFKAMSDADKRLGKAEDLMRRDDDPSLIYEGKAVATDLWAFHVRPGEHDVELALPRAELVARAEALVAGYEPGDAAMLVRLWEAWQTAEGPDRTVRIAEIDVLNPLERQPAVFSAENIERARRDLIDHPDSGQDALLRGKLTYSKDESAARDFSRSTAMGIGPVPTGPRPFAYDAMVMFIVGFTEWTTAQALGRSPLPGHTLTSDKRLDSALADVRFVVEMLRAALDLREVRETRARWQKVRPVISKVLEWARKNEFDPKDVVEGSERVSARLDRYEVAVRVRDSAAEVRLPVPHAGLLEEEALKLRRELQVLHTKLWDLRHAIRAGSMVTTIVATETEVRFQNAARTIVGWISIVDEGRTLAERKRLARQRGLRFPDTVTELTFVSHVTSTVTETIGIFLNISERFAPQWKTALSALGRVLTGVAGIGQIISGIGEFLNAQTGTQTRAATHTIAQGVVQTGGALTGAKPVVIARVSGALVVIWAVIEALAIASENIAAGYVPDKIDVIRPVLQRARRVVYWGTRLAGVGDAWEKADPEDALRLRDEFIREASEPYRYVVEQMLAVGAAMRRGAFATDLDAVEETALRRLKHYEYRGTSEFAPGDIREITEVCLVLFAALERIGVKAARSAQ